MGLGTSHGCWRGAYSAFMTWRCEIARIAGIPLLLMDGFHRCPDATAMEWAAARNGGPKCGSYNGPMLHGWCEQVDALLPIRWEVLKPDPLHILLSHSDCDGEIAWENCAAIADRLEECLPLLPTTPDPGHIGDWREKTQTFIDGLRRAAAAHENVRFH